MMCARLAALVIMLIPITAAEQVELHLRTGAVVRGEVVSEDNDKLVVKTTSVGKSGKAMSITMPYKRADIAEVVKLADPEELYRSKSKAAATAEEHAALATWCREQNLTDQAVEQAKKAVEMDATQEAAVKLLADLDWVRLDGKWVHESEALAAQGKVRYQGKVMTVAEAEALKATAQKQAAANDAQRATDEKAGSVASFDRQIAEIKKRQTQADADLAKANSDLSSAQGQAQKLAQAKSTLDAAQKNLDQARAANQNQVGGGANTNNGTNLLPLTQAVENAQKALMAARREAGSADAQEAQAKAKITALANEKKTLEKKLEDLTAKREAAVKALEQAKAAGATDPKPAAGPPKAPDKDATKPAP